MFWRGRSRQGPARSVTWRRQALTLAALVAVFLQAFVVQTHIHAPVMPIATQSGDVTHEHVTAHASAVNQHQLACVICQTLATNGVATLANTATILVAQQTTAAATLALAIAPRVHTHSWQSRAPPSIL